MGPAHTSNDVVLWVPATARVLGRHHFQRRHALRHRRVRGGLADRVGAAASLGRGDDRAGHGPVCGPEVIDDMAAYLRFVQELARKSFESGLVPLEAARGAELGRFAGWHDAEQLAGNLHRGLLGDQRASLWARPWTPGR